MRFFLPKILRGGSAQGRAGDRVPLRALLLALALAVAGPAAAVEPSEMLADPALEARAQALDHELRCVKCRSESIASSGADWARDARIMVRELLSDGASDAEVKAFFVDRYGDYVLMTPRAEGENLLLWAAGPLMLLGGGAVAVMALRRRRTAAPEDLSDDERRRLDEILNS